MTHLDSYLSCLKALGFKEVSGHGPWSLGDLEYLRSERNGIVTIDIGGTSGYSGFYSFMEFDNGRLIRHGAVE